MTKKHSPSFLFTTTLVVSALLTQGAAAQNTQQVNSLWKKTSVKVFCGVNNFLGINACNNVTNVGKAIVVTTQTQPTPTNTPSATQNQNNNVPTSTGLVSTTQTPTYITQTPQYITNPIREIRTIIEYRNAAVGPKGDTGPTGPQGPAGISSGGYVSTGWIGGNYTVGSPATSLTNGTVSNSALTDNTFSGNNIFTQLPTLPLIQGGIFVGNASGTAAVLNPGTVNQVLVINASGTPTWTTAAAFTGSTTNALSFATSTGTNILTSTVNGLSATTTISELANLKLSGTTTLGTISSNATSTLSSVVSNLVNSVTGIFQTLYAQVINAGSIITGNITATGTAQFATTTIGNLALNPINTATSSNTVLVRDPLTGEVKELSAAGLLGSSTTNVLAYATSTGTLTSTVNGVAATSPLGALLAGKFWQQGGNSYGALGVLGTNDSNDLSFITNGVEAVRVAVNGRVGIGSGATTPLAQLHVSGGGTILGRSFSGVGLDSTNVVTHFRIQRKGNDTLVTTGDRFEITSRGTGAGTLDQVRFSFINDSNVASTVMNFAANGNIGIGASTPANALHIASSTGAISGLRLGVTSATATTTSNGKVLTVNPNGDVVLVDGVGSITNTLTYATSTGNLTSTVNGVVATTSFNGLTTTNFAANAGITNGQLANSSFTTTIGTSGTDVNVSGSPTALGGTLTINLPDASATARGLVTTGAQTFAGAKTFSSAPTFSTMTPGSVFFAGASGLLSQNNANFFWDNTNSRLGIGTSIPTYKLDIIQAGSGDIFHVRNSSNAFEAVIGTNSNSTYLGSGNTNLAFSTNGTERMRIDIASGNVGIGTETPSNLFTVESNLDSGRGALIDNKNDGTSAFSRLSLSSGTADPTTGYIGTFSPTYGTAQLADRLIIRSNSGTANGITMNAVAGDIVLNTDGSAAGAHLVVKDITGRIGVGTSSPYSSLSNTSTNIVGSSWGTSVNGLSWLQSTAGDGGFALAIQNDGTSASAAGILSKITSIASNTPIFEGISGGLTRFVVQGNGNIGIGTSAPSAQLHTTGTVRLSNFGAGTLTTDASGNLSVSSDERLKNVSGTFTKGLESLLGINPVAYKWNTESGLETEGTYYGFSAQNVQANLPEAIGVDNRGYLTLSDRPLLATAINSIKELNTKIETGFTSISLTATTTSEVDQSIINILTETPRIAVEYIKSQMIQGKKAINDFTANRVTAIRGYFDEIFAKKIHTEQICVKKSDGSEVCVDGDQLQNMVNGQAANQPQSGMTGAMIDAINTSNSASANPESNESSAEVESNTEPINTDSVETPAPAVDPEPESIVDPSAVTE